VGKWKIEFYQSKSGNPVVYDWFLAQETKVKARLAQIFDLLQDKGTSVGMPYVRSIVNTKLYDSPFGNTTDSVLITDSIYICGIN